ncbi:mitochondrial potassium channel ATP-binding subunit isoform X1 [Vespa crabro]|uniref:mitochondrial potassium channel ATP-binding subunit isoform X1 n=1 Tax=Vespa crabro TaxID=7445 RepID=UPI001F01B61E|nr:mitochondrial potassium channel ATP-binding subunit isoform X1 [Vespa crabro]
MSILRIIRYKQQAIFPLIAREFFLINPSKGKNNVLVQFKRDFNATFKTSIKEEQKKQKELSNIYKVGWGILGTGATYIFKINVKQVTCEAIKENNEVRKNSDRLHFQWKDFLEYLYPHIWQLLISLSSALIVAMLNIWIPQSVGNIINVLTKIVQDKGNDSTRNTLEMLLRPTFLLARMYVAQAFFTFVYIYTLSQIGERVAMKLRQNVFKSIIVQDVAFFDKNRTGEIVSRLTSDIQDFKSTFKICISQGLRSSTQIIGCVISVIMLSPQLTAAMLLCMPTVIFIGTLLGKSLRKLSIEAQNQVAKATAVSEEAIQNIRTVRAFAAETREAQVFSNEVEHASKLYENLGFGIGLFQAGTNLFLNGILLCTLYFGGHLMSIGQLTSGDLMAFLMATQIVQRSLSQLSLLFGTYVRGISAGARVFEYLNMPPSPMMVGGTTINDSLSGNIEFKNVKFSYPTRPDHVILKNFNLDISAGKTVAIVGTSGNGKSTIAALLERFYDVDEGSISIDKKDIRSLNSSYLRGTILGYINQEPVLFATSIMENIRYGKQDATDEEIVKAAKQANAHEFITKFPNGYETQVGERGAQLSGGQKQRIAIARALLKQPSILILDEATSALDYESERMVQEALENVTRGRTVLIIAHRLSTIKSADIIVVLQHGVIVEMGTHSQLIKKQGPYHTLLSEQMTEDGNNLA